MTSTSIRPANKKYYHIVVEEQSTQYRDKKVISCWRHGLIDTSTIHSDAKSCWETSLKFHSCVSYRNMCKFSLKSKYLFDIQQIPEKFGCPHNLLELTIPVHMYILGSASPRIVCKEWSESLIWAYLKKDRHINNAKF